MYNAIKNVLIEWYAVKLDTTNKATLREIPNMVNWCDDNLDGEYTVMYNSFYFERQQDYFIFLLNFSEHRVEQTHN